jgi:predicted ATPase
MVRRTNLLSPLGRFVGRAGLLATLDEHVARGDRLLTLLGPGGMGKTRLAQRYGETRGASYVAAGGVWFCDLTEAREVSDLCAVVARALDLRMETELDVRAAAEDVGQALAHAGALLLVLDNFEQLPAAAALVVEHWCAVAAEACVIVTSRARLRVAGEVVVELLPLAVPSPDATDPQEILASEAVALFRERASAAGGHGAARADAVDARDLAALVRELDGIPLAIELAAARCRVLAPRELLARLASRGGLVATGERSGSRHATLRAAIDWSWNMLSDADKSTLAQCAVFAGEFSLEAAEAVVDLSELGGAPDVVDVVAALRDKSLVRSVGAATTSTRLALYVSIREYAQEHAARRADAAALVDRHRRYYVDSTRAAAETFARRGDAPSRAVLRSEKENLLAIQRGLRARGALSRADAEDLARVVLSLQPVIEAETAYEDLIAMISDGIAASEAARDDALRGRLLVARGNAYGLRGEAVSCLGDLEAARDLGRATGDRPLEAEALLMAGVRYRQQGRLDEAWSAGSEAATMLEGAGYPRMEGANLAVMGFLLCELGRAEESRRYNVRARALFSEAGDRWSEALTLANLAQLDQAAGEVERAALGYEGALERFREVGDRRYEGRYLGYLAGLDLERGREGAARAGYESSLDLLVSFRMRHGEGLFRACLGALEASESRAREAVNQLDRAEDLLRSLEAPSFVASVGVHRGHLDLLLSREAAARGESERAAAHEAAARARLANVSFAASSEDVRFAMRLLERALARHLPGARAPARVRPRLAVGPSARWFRTADGPVVELGRRASLRLILLALVQRRIKAPDEAIGGEALLALGWPGERILAGAGATRVRVGISTLRRLGLAGLLLTREDGYLLDPRADVLEEPDV